MLGFIKKINLEDIPAVRALMAGITTMFTYSLLVWLINSVYISWFVLPLALSGVLCTVTASFIEDKQTIKRGEYKLGKTIYLFTFTNVIIFWFLVFYLCFSLIKIDNFTCILVCLSAFFTVLRTLSASLMLPSLMNSAKKASNIHDKFKNNQASTLALTKELEAESKRMKRELPKAFIFVFFPAVLSVVFLWWSFYRIFIIMNIQAQFVVYVIFVILFEIILSNFKEKLKKQLINQSILKSDGQERN